MRALSFIVLLVLAACGGTGADTSGDVLQRDQFRDLLLEATLIEARINHELIVDHRSAVPSQQYYDELFKAKGVTQEQFSRSFDHYAARPKEMKAIYEEILTELSRRKDEQVVK